MEWIKKFVKGFLFMIIPMLIGLAIYFYNEYKNFDEYKKIQIKDKIQYEFNK